MVSEFNRLSKAQDPNYMFSHHIASYALTEQQENRLALTSTDTDNNERYASGWMTGRDVLERLDTIERKMVVQFPELRPEGKSVDYGLFLPFSDEDIKSSYENWKALKERHPEELTVMLFGDSYLAYGVDAKKASEVLGVGAVVTKDEGVLVTSLPFEKMEGYVRDLKAAGVKMAIINDYEKELSPKQEEPARPAVDPKQAYRDKWANYDYTQNKMPAGTVVENCQVKTIEPKGGEKYKTYEIRATINGKYYSSKMYPNDVTAFFDKNKDGVRRAEPGQLAAKYFAKAVAKAMEDSKAQAQAAEPLQPEKKVVFQKGDIAASPADGNGVKIVGRVDSIDDTTLHYTVSNGHVMVQQSIYLKNTQDWTPATDTEKEAFVNEEKRVLSTDAGKDQQERREQAEAAKVAVQDKAAEEQKQREEEKKREQEEAKKKETESKKAPVLVSALQTGLLLGALATAGKNGGLWLNKDYKQAPDFLHKGQPVSAFNALMMALNSDANGYKTNVYTTFQAAKDDGYFVRKGETGLPINWYNWDQYANKYMANDVIDKEQYDALSDEQKENYKVQLHKEERKVFNIDQTSMRESADDDYAKLLDSQAEKSVVKAPAVSVDANAETLQYLDELHAQNPGAILIMGHDDYYDIYGDDVKLVADLELPIQVSKDLKDKDGRPMAMVTFPAEALDTYLPMIVRSGNQVAICDRLEDRELRLKYDAADRIYGHAQGLTAALEKDSRKVLVGASSSTGYDCKEKVLRIDDSRHAPVGQEVSTAIRRTAELYRAAVAFTGCEDKLNRYGRANTLPEYADKYDRLRCDDGTSGITCIHLRGEHETDSLLGA